ncbi:bifunctional phosphopantothenoylcysteine decarboxylase/phosphopantothenate--cysteine ligase CoaBC [Pelovirga terrestris]|uniref:Coenzyme A biosynthesis bifunctional protein CoaBC n=1 Tax=Pelovirga terrestris TaxID=2771352 RepID=A0A8J6QWM5_9BACT|nr:bifunctional phosphopantothenoylcysteine decarboxylase/phosphopantothenate--cysteine ligase CoaBC [Pelovirga terrestris]MBD1399207.1 bifunctional phosphopantothenoylcysteine decarboxylase/phosphopantothenate--cysteine ligase CoaBC [Pelovirga terrestris]
MLKGKTIILGVSGGIAVYKAVELLRLLTKAGVKVHVVMTRSACEFVTPLTFQTLSGQPVHTELFNLYQEQEIGHISLADRADLFILAPATANLIGRIAQGLADDLLTTTVLATKAPVLIVPAMNTNMYENPLYQRNEQRLREVGYHLLEPVYGELACGWTGQGKMPDPQDIVDAAEDVLTGKDLAGCRILVSAGPTREEIDPVRYLSNRSSGRMGFAIAAAARRRGAIVTLVAGPVQLMPPAGVEVVSVVSARQMHEVMLGRFAAADVVIKAAAVADYRPMIRQQQKMKKKSEEFILDLEKTPDILAELGQRKAHQILVGFAAETEDLLEHARKKLVSKNLDMIVANDVSIPGAGFDVDTNIVRFIYRNGEMENLELMSKTDVANHLLDRICPLWKKTC